jgi:hypothetical protein
VAASLKTGVSPFESIYLPRNGLSSVFCFLAVPPKLEVLLEQKKMLRAEDRRDIRPLSCQRYARPHHHPRDVFYLVATPELLKSWHSAQKSTQRQRGVSLAVELQAERSCCLAKSPKQPLLFLAEHTIDQGPQE